MPTHAPYAQWTEGAPLATGAGAQSVSIFPAYMSFANPGFADTLVASSIGPDGLPLATSYAWTSSDLFVATVSPTGYVQTTGAGMALVRATAASGAYAEVVVSVGVVALLKQDGEPWKAIQSIHGGAALGEASAAYVYAGGVWVQIL